MLPTPIQVVSPTICNVMTEIYRFDLILILCYWTLLGTIFSYISIRTCAV